MNSSDEYLNEYGKILLYCKGKDKVEQIKLLADKGNIQACWYYAETLMEGAWDVERMELDLACDRLIPVPLDPRTDPYLYIKRDQYAAIEYYKKAANFEHSQCDEVIRSGGMLAFMRKRMDIGYNLCRYSDQEICAKLEAYAADAPLEDQQMNPFMPYPLARPKIKNPRTAVFKELAKLTREKATVDIFLAFLPFLVYILATAIKYGEGKRAPLWPYLCGLYMLAFIVVAFSAPLGIFTLLNYLYGGKQQMPLCSCDAIRRAYDIRVMKLPVECRKRDPFGEAPWLIRNLHQIRLGFFSLYLIPAIIATVLIIQNNEYMLKLSEYFGNFFIWSIISLLYIFPLFLILYYKTFTFADRDCLEQEENAVKGVEI